MKAVSPERVFKKDQYCDVPMHKAIIPSDNNMFVINIGIAIKLIDIFSNIMFPINDTNLARNKLPISVL